MELLSLQDVETMIRIVATAGDPTVEMPLLERKQQLMEDLVELIDADVWMWNLAVVNPARAKDVIASRVLHGGWREEKEQMAIMQLLTKPEFNSHFAGHLENAVTNQRHTTFVRPELIPPDVWTKVGRPWRAAGYDSSILSIYPLDSGVFSGVGFHRVLGKPDFGERERTIAHIILQQVDWLHRSETQISANQHVVNLSARQREVLFYLLNGESAKQIAHKLTLSEYTVGDHIKGIYKKFSVGSRAELLSHFVTGGQSLA